jgi:hypothetical protein
MPTIAANASAQISLAAGSRLRFLPTGDGVAVVGNSSVVSAGTTYDLGPIETTIGPFDGPRVVSVSANRLLDYEVQVPPFGLYLSNGSQVVSQAPSGALLDADQDAILSAADVAAAASLAPNAMPPELQPTNWFSDELFSGGHNLLYGREIANRLNFVRVNPVTRARTVTANPFGVSSPQLIRTIVTTSVPGLLFACIGESTQTAASMRIWRSTDFGATWSQVLVLGSGPGGASTGVWILS